METTIKYGGYNLANKYSKSLNSINNIHYSWQLYCNGNIIKIIVDFVWNSNFEAKRNKNLCEKDNLLIKRTIYPKSCIKRQDSIFPQDLLDSLIQWLMIYLNLLNKYFQMDCIIINLNKIDFNLIFLY